MAQKAIHCNDCGTYLFRVLEVEGEYFLHLEPKHHGAEHPQIVSFKDLKANLVDKEKNCDVK